MSDIALRVEGLGKRYRLGLEQASTTGGFYRYKSLRDTLGGFSKAPLKTMRTAMVRQPMNETNSFWALKDINFEVKRGEVVGIIGRNGAGKSTLLKILSQITKPTTGRVDLFGRVGSLLEVGTGFHPELSGRENIYLNGAILGMTRAEVKTKFDEIVAFSEIEKFLDTPVKQYSSGMYMRLAFAVAAHLEPEILVVDEVLAVGDAEFQKKCLGKMKDVADEGRTVLFVSHNMNAIETLCSSSLVLANGRALGRFPSAKAIEMYLSTGTVSRPRTNGPRPGPYVSGLCVLNSGGQVVNVLQRNSRFIIEMSVGTTKDVRSVIPGVNLIASNGSRVATLWGGFSGFATHLKAGQTNLRLLIDGLNLAPGAYSLSGTLGLDGEHLDELEDGVDLELVAGDGEHMVRWPDGLSQGASFPVHEWMEPR